MSRMLKGVIRDGRIHLQEDAGLPSGTPVVVRLDAESRASVFESFGAWKDDPSIVEIFDEISRLRKAPARLTPGA